MPANGLPLTGYRWQADSRPLRAPHSFLCSLKTLASGSEDGTVKLWDLATGNLRATFRGHGAQVDSVAFSPDGKTLASAAADRKVKLWDVATGEQRATFSGALLDAPNTREPGRSGGIRWIWA